MAPIIWEAHNIEALRLPEILIDILDVLLRLKLVFVKECKRSQNALLLVVERLKCFTSGELRVVMDVNRNIAFLPWQLIKSQWDNTLMALCHQFNKHCIHGKYFNDWSLFRNYCQHLSTIGDKLIQDNLLCFYPLLNNVDLIFKI